MRGRGIRDMSRTDTGYVPSKHGICTGYVRGLLADVKSPSLMYEIEALQNTHMRRPCLRYQLKLIERNVINVIIRHNYMVIMCVVASSKSNMSSDKQRHPAVSGSLDTSSLRTVR